MVIAAARCCKMSCIIVLTWHLQPGVNIGMDAYIRIGMDAYIRIYTGAALALSDSRCEVLLQPDAIQHQISVLRYDSFRSSNSVSNPAEQPVSLRHCAVSLRLLWRSVVTRQRNFTGIFWQYVVLMAVT
jgi:hypothetical protein